MAGFFPINPGGGGAGGGQNPATAFVGAQLQGNTIVFSRENGGVHVVDLSQIVPTDLVTNVELNNTTLVITKKDGTTDNIDLAPLVGVRTFNYDIPTRTITVTDENGRQHTVPHIITEWDDLEFVSKTKNNIRNIFNKHTQIVKDRYYTPVTGGRYEIHTDTNWDLAYMEVAPGQQITLIKNAHDSQNYGVYDAQLAHHQHISVSGQLVNGMRVYRMTIDSALPPGNTYYLLINMYKNGNNAIDPNKVMVFDGNIPNPDLPKEYIPYSSHGSIFIDGSEVVHTFDPTGSSLVSQNTQDAIIELDGKSIKTVNNVQPVDGNITVNAGDIDYDNRQSQIQANNVQDAIDKLKEDMGLLDTSDIHIVADKTELNDLLNNQNKVKHGDLIYIINSDGVEDYTGTVVGSANNPIAMIYDNNITGNKLRVFSRFSSVINISADTVTYNDNTTHLTANNVQEAIEKLKEKVDEGVTSVVFNNNNNTLAVTKNGQPTLYDLSSLIGIKTINGQAGIDGAISLTVDETADTIDFKVDGQTYKTLNYMTDAQADAIINNWN